MSKGVDMFTKRSTLVDQNFESECIDSKLSIAIFVAPKTHLGTQECIIYSKNSKKQTIRVAWFLGLHYCAIYYVFPSSQNREGKSWLGHNVSPGIMRNMAYFVMKGPISRVKLRPRIGIVTLERKASSKNQTRWERFRT